MGYHHKSPIDAIGDRFIFNDRETAAMSVATAVGGCQLLIINKLSGKEGAAISWASPTTRAVGVIGGASLGLGVAGLLGKVGLGRTVSAGLMGYGMSTLISIGLPILLSTFTGSGARGSIT
ncbi:MAG: hypothetical protein PHT84_03670 [Candidatus Pacebacteria bacterium]|nr:hypothetical protein [Candidatus Paceibacterota bacterium]